MIALETAGEDWVRAYRVAVLMARAGRRAGLLEAPLEVVEAGHPVVLPRGCLLVEAAPADLPEPEVAFREVQVAEPGGMLRIAAVRIAVYGGGGAPYNHAAAFADLGFDVDFIMPDAILAGRLAEFDVLVVPGGGNRAMEGQLGPLGDEGTQAIADFVAGGGMYLASCAGSIAASVLEGDITELCPQQVRMQLVNAGPWNRAGGWLTVHSPGIGVMRSRIVGDHPVTLGLPPEIDIVHYNGPLFAMMPGKLPLAGEAEPLLEVSGVTGNFTAGETFLNGGDATDPGLLVNRAADEGVASAVAGRYGDGCVVLFGSHPESGEDVVLGPWGRAAQLMANAAIWQAGAARGRAVAAPDGKEPTVGIRQGFEAARARLDAITEQAGSLLSRDTSEVDWLLPDRAMAMFGKSATHFWQARLAAVPEMAAAIRAVAEGIEGAIATPPAGPEERRSRLALDAAIHHVMPPEWEMDVGYEGLLQHLDRGFAMLVRADRDFDRSFAPARDPYEHLGESPFHLAVGSYLAATGILDNCLLLMRQHAASLRNAAALDLLAARDTASTTSEGPR